jgi:glutathione synthase/RimK-type ligase-like ATP-grasp enzyme
MVFKKTILLVYEKIRTNNEWRHNLQLGATPKMVDDNKLLNKLKTIINNIWQHLDIKLGAIDIVNVRNKLYVLEINPGIMLEKFATYSKKNYKIAKKIYWKILKDN